MGTLTTNVVTMAVSRHTTAATANIKPSVCRVKYSPTQRATRLNNVAGVSTRIGSARLLTIRLPTTRNTSAENIVLLRVRDNQVPQNTPTVRASKNNDTNSMIFKVITTAVLLLRSRMCQLWDSPRPIRITLRRRQQEVWMPQNPPYLFVPSPGQTPIRLRLYSSSGWLG
jgi:hypothetical protein